MHFPSIKKLKKCLIKMNVHIYAYLQYKKQHEYIDFMQQLKCIMLTVKIWNKQWH